jgi:pimeloyl-ACP methyl ester carboxylesterase
MVEFATGAGICFVVCVLGLSRTVRCLAGHCISSLLLGFVVLVAYWRLYVEFMSGRWWRPDVALQRLLRPAELHSTKAVPVDEVKHSFDTEFYVEDHGFDCERHEVTTEDGYILHCFRVFKKDARDLSLPPILLQHGLFQSSGIFVTSEEDSMAFHFANKGYDVWLGNNRCIHEKGHTTMKPHEAQYWEWGLDELGLFDFPAFVDHVTKATGHEKVVFVGHSQGNAQAFVGLSRNPQVAQKLELFVALAPAFYIGRLGHWALEAMVSMPSCIFYQLFGECSFIPVMYVVQRLMAPQAFGHLAYNMFNYLFSWGDTYWCHWRKTKYFLFTPRPVSSRLIHHWGEITRTGQLKPYTAMRKDTIADNELGPEAASEREERAKVYSVANIGCPVALFYGGKDKLVQGKALVETLQASKEVDLVHHSEIPHYEHMDVVWAHDARDTVFDPIDSLIRNAGKLRRA